MHSTVVQNRCLTKPLCRAVRLQVFVEAMSNQSLPHDGVEGSGVYMREVYAKKLPCGLQRGVDVP
jgi:hypothetical protein